MSMTSYGVNDPEAVKLWSRKVAREAMANAWIQRFTGRSNDSIIQIHEDFKKSDGDTLTHLLRMQLDGAGVKGDETLEGNEEALTTYTDKFVIDQLRNATRSKGKMSEQRVPFKYRAEAMQSLRDWWATRLDRWFFTQACGFTGGQITDRGETYSGQDVRFTGLNPVSAPDSSAHFRADDNSGTITFTATAKDEDITSSDTMRLEYIDELKAVAETRAPIIRPVMWQGEKLYVFVMDTLAAKALRTNTSTGQWQDIQKAAMAGGDVKKNPIFTGALGMYNNVILFSSNRICPGVHSSTGAIIPSVRRNVFLGAQAAAMGFAGGTSEEKFSWHEELFDYGNQLGVEAGIIGGLKKSVYNSKDYGVLVFSTYAA